MSLLTLGRRDGAPFYVPAFKMVLYWMNSVGSFPTMRLPAVATVLSSASVIASIIKPQWKAMKRKRKRIKDSIKV